MTDPPLLEARRLGKRIGRRLVFSGIDLSVHGGRVVAIAGANGSGKSTLLRVLSGSSAPTQGTLRSAVSDRALVPERFVPPDHMTPLAYLLHMERLRGRRTADVRGRAVALLEELQVTDPATAMLEDLSKGNAQKVAIAQAFLSACPLVFLDEPNTGLDDAATSVLHGLIRAAVATGAAVVLTEHERTRSVRPDEQYELLDGRLSPSEIDVGAGEPTVLVELSHPLGAQSVGVERLPRVRSVSSADGGARSFQVESGRVDQFLRAALDDGWSVIVVRPALENGGPR